MSLKENWCILFALAVLAVLAAWTCLDYLHTGQVDFRFVLTSALGFTIGITVFRKRR